MQMVSFNHTSEEAYRGDREYRRGKFSELEEALTKMQQLIELLKSRHHLPVMEAKERIPGFFSS
jgi:hypothetical protein